MSASGVAAHLRGCVDTSSLPARLARSRKAAALVGKQQAPARRGACIVPSKRRTTCSAEPGAPSLLARDRQFGEVAEDKLPAAFLDAPESGPAKGLSTAGDGEQVASGSPDSSGGSASTAINPQDPGARTAGEAIEAGIARLGAGEARAAVDLFQAALELPGNGAFRMSGTVREYRCASEAEEQSALYNMACAYAALGKRDSALTCLEACLEAGFQDFVTLRQDPDLAAIRGAALDQLLGKYDGLLAKVFKRRRKPDGPGPRPWFEVL